MNQQVREGEELEAKNIRRFLEEKGLFPQSTAEMEITQFSNGFSNLTYQVKLEDTELILRRPPFGAVKRGHDMGREYKVLSRLQKAFPQSPLALAYTEDLEITGAPFYIMEKISGPILSIKEAKKRKLSPAEYKKVSEQWLQTFVNLHKTDYRSVGLEDLGKPDGYVERQVRNWSKQYEAAATKDLQVAKDLMQWLHENQTTDYDHCFIHNDYKYDNVVFTDDSWTEIKAVLDWEMCTLGDPLMDLGSSLAYWTMKADGPMVMQGLPSPTMFEGNLSRTELVQSYAEKSGRDIKYLGFYYAFGLFKLAVIVQQLFFRYKKGLTQDKRFAHLDQSAEFLCLMAWQSVQKKKIDHLF